MPGRGASLPIGIALLALCAAASCAPALVAVRPYPAPTGDQLLGNLRARHTALRTLNVVTRTKSWLGGDHLSADVLMLVDRAGRLRFEAEVTLAGTVAILATDGRTFSFWDKQHNLFRTGPACAGSVAMLIRIPLLPREIAAILLGDAPLAEGARPVQVTWDPRQAADVLELAAPAGGPNVTGGTDVTGRLWVSLRRRNDNVGFDIVAVEGQIPAANGRWRVAYSRFETVGGLSLPSLIQFAEPGNSFDDGVEIKVKDDRIVNAPLQDAAFLLPPPPGVPVEHVPCTSAPR